MTREHCDPELWFRFRDASKLRSPFFLSFFFFFLMKKNVPYLCFLCPLSLALCTMILRQLSQQQTKAYSNAVVTTAANGKKNETDQDDWITELRK